MKLVKSGPTGSDDTATYDVVEYPKKLADFIQEVLKRINEWGSIKIKGYGSIDYKYGKSSNDIPKVLNNLTISDVKASGGWSYMCYYISIEKQEKTLSELDKAACDAYSRLQDEDKLSFLEIFKAGVEYQQDKYDKLKAIAEKMYTAAQYLSDNPNSAESLREGMQQYYNFINNIKV